MKNIIIFTTIVALFASCNNSQTNKEEKTEKLVTDSTIDLNLAEVSEIHFKATRLVNFDKPKISVLNEPIDIAALITKKDKALYLLDSVVNLPKFKTAIKNIKFTHTNNKTNEEIYNLFVSNDPKIKFIREHLILTIDTTYLWNVTYQRGRHPSIGYDNSRGDSIVHTVQVQLVKKLTAQDYAAHIAHEYCHMIGFVHPRPGKWESVPYGIQHTIENMLEVKEQNLFYQ